MPFFFEEYVATAEIPARIARFGTVAPDLIRGPDPGFLRPQE